MELGPTATWRSDTYAGIDPKQPSLSLAGKTVAITGGGSGIGFAIAISCAKAGASNIALIGRRSNVLEKARSDILAVSGPHTDVLCLQADISNPDEIQGAFREIKDTVGSVDILISNAGHFQGAAPMAEVSVPDWFSSFEINVKGSLLTAAAFLSVASAEPKIVNVSSAIAHLSPAFFPGFSAYSASKIAALQMFAYLSHERPDVHVVSLHPGRILTDMSAKVGRVPGKAQVVDTPELAADFTVWTLSNEARFLNGKMVWANWDVNELKEKREDIEGSDLLTISIQGWPFEGVARKV